MSIRRLLVLTSSLFLAVNASAQIVNCSSNDMHRKNCYANTSRGVRIERQLSGSPCVQGRDWGYGTQAIWVDHGCRADFALNVGGLPPQQSSSQSSPQDAMRACKNTAGERLPNVPLAYISVQRGSDTGNGRYMINFHAQPPRGPQTSGFCIVARNGHMDTFQFDSNSGGFGGGGNPMPANDNGQSKQDAMRDCKNAVSARRPNVPLAFIHVDQARVNGGSQSVNFQVQPPNGPSSSGNCDVFKNDRVNVQFTGR
jgi:hypothetical protein